MSWSVYSGRSAIYFIRAYSYQGFIMNGIERDPGRERYRLTLTGTIDVFEAAAVLETAREAAAADRPISIHIEELERLDTSILQILLALQREVQRRGQSLQVVGDNPAIRRTCILLGSHRHLFEAPSVLEG
jgi:anti-anti-sigma factor